MYIEHKSTTAHNDIILSSFFLVLAICIYCFYKSGSEIGINYLGIIIIFFLLSLSAFGAYTAMHPNICILKSNGEWFEISMNKNLICRGNLNDIACVVTDGNDITVPDVEGGDKVVRIRRKVIIMKDKSTFHLPIQFNKLSIKLERLIVDG